MCACGKAQRISLWLDLFEWTESFLRNRLTNAAASPVGRRAQWDGLRCVEGSRIAALIPLTPITFAW